MRADVYSYSYCTGLLHAQEYCMPLIYVSVRYEYSCYGTRTFYKAEAEAEVWLSRNRGMVRPDAGVLGTAY